MSTTETIGEYHTCTSKNPYNIDMKLPAHHPDAFPLSEFVYLEEVYEVYFCPNCQTKFHTAKPR